MFSLIDLLRVILFLILLNIRIVFFRFLILLRIKCFSFIMILDGYFTTHIRILNILVILDHLLEILVPLLPALLDHDLALISDPLNTFFDKGDSMKGYFLDCPWPLICKTFELVI